MANLLLALAVGAHAELRRVDAQNGAVIAAPAQVTLAFSGETSATRLFPRAGAWT